MGWRGTTATPPGPWSAPTWWWRAGSTGQRPAGAADPHRQACDDHAPWCRSGTPGRVEERQKMDGNGWSHLRASENADAHEPLHRQQAEHETDPAVNDGLQQAVGAFLRIEQFAQDLLLLRRGLAQRAMEQAWQFGQQLGVMRCLGP